jgi:hypothetical protein
MHSINRLPVLLLLCGTMVSGGGCAGKTSSGTAQPRPDAVVFEDRLTVGENDDKSPLRIAPVQLPAAGECRLWFPGKALREPELAARSSPQHRPTAGSCTGHGPTPA